VRVLTAESEALIRMDLREMLEDEGHDVVAEACSGTEAVVLARSCQPDVCFVGINMPAVSGIEATAAISAEAIAPVVILTAFARATLVDEATRAGAIGYLAKPFSRDDLVAAMELAAAFAQRRQDAPTIPPGKGSVD